MTKKKKKSKKGIENKFLSVLLILVTVIVGICFSEIDGTYSANMVSDNNDNINAQEVIKEINDDLRVSFLDVGQADSILIENKDEAMLIDAGNNEDGKLLVKYFNNLGITNFKYLVGTHPHEDHIGGMDDVINNFEVETIYLPDCFTTTKTFVDVLDAMENKNINYTVPKIGDSFELGDAILEVIYTGNDANDLNNSSIVLRLTYGNNSFLFMGDATSSVEKKILSSKMNIGADVLKIGHHGSKYSSTNLFLDKVNAKYAVISVGERNSYKHPHDVTLKKLEKRNIIVHRTDMEGTIIATSDGENITITNIKTNLNGG